MRKLLLFGFVLAVIAGVVGWKMYNRVYTPVVEMENDSTYFYIPTGATYDSVIQSLSEQDWITDDHNLVWVSKKKNYQNKVKPGRYKIRNGMNSAELIDLLRSGEQSPLKVTFTSTRSLLNVAGKVANYLEGDSSSFAKYFTSPELAFQFGFDAVNFSTMFLPNTYEFYWNTSAEDFTKKMALEYKKFWNKDRQGKANSLGLSQSECTTLASIVQAEQLEKPEEWPTIAGLYLNRIRAGIPLQSDPTVKFAVGDPGIKRVLNNHLEFISPYNTYLYPGLPPGPIYIPDPGAIDAVLNAEKHDYIYMCAKDDFSGFHHFSKSLNEHNTHARAYQKKLDHLKIYN